MSKHAAASQNLAACTCRHAADCCPDCYGQRRADLASRLYEAQLATALLMREATELELDYALHSRT